MKRKHWLALGAAVLVGLAGLRSGVVQSAGATVINWWVVAGGGGPASAGTVTLNSTVGQPIIGASTSGDESVVLGAGYWPSLAVVPAGVGHNVYLPAIFKP